MLPSLFAPNLNRVKYTASGSASFLSLTFIRLSDELSLQNLAELSLNVFLLVVEFWYISFHASFTFFINRRPRFLSRSSIFSNFTFILVVHLLVLLKIVPSSILICVSSLSKFTFDSFLNLAGLSLSFCFDMWFFSTYCLSHLRFNINYIHCIYSFLRILLPLATLLIICICWQTVFYLSFSIWNSFISSYVVSLKCSIFAVSVVWLSLILIYISHKHFWICTGHQSL